MSDVLLRERRGAVEVLTLNRPEKRNALNRELLDALGAAFAELESDDDVRVIVLTGAGDRAFSAGMDLAEFASGGGGGQSVAEQADAPAADEVDPTRHQIISWEYPKPIVAALNGATVAGGFEIMLCCDLVVAAEHVKFGLAEVKRGLMPGGGGTLLATRIPMAIALEITLIGDTIESSRALELGLINRVVPSGHEVDEAVALAQKIAENGPLAVEVVKRLVRRGATEGGGAAWPHPKEIGAVFASEDAREGALAFVEKRPARFVGR
jgi:enoyl-CoA hydratase